MERDRYNRERKERISSPLDYGVCETEERAEKISAGTTLTDEEEQALNENIFDQDDTLMVVTEMSDGTDSVFAVTVQQIEVADCTLPTLLGFLRVRQLLKRQLNKPITQATMKAEKVF